HQLRWGRHLAAHFFNLYIIFLVFAMMAINMGGGTPPPPSIDCRKKSRRTTALLQALVLRQKS
ncbi:MAG: hypothetical protein ACIAQ0_14435, partial [Phycisphaerales bacterium JB058]